MRTLTEIKATLPFLLFLLLQIEAKKPPGFVEKAKDIDPDPPNYEYGYKIKDKQAEQSKDEKREGQFSQGSFYVKDSEAGVDSQKKIKYFTDDWGFHTIAEYSNKGPNSKSSVTFIADQEALKYNKNGNIIPDLDPNNNNNKETETDPLLQNPSLVQPPTPTRPNPLLSQEQVILDPSQVIPKPTTPLDPQSQENVSPPQSGVQDPSQLQFFYIEPDSIQQHSVAFAPSALDNQYSQLQQILLQGEVLPAPQPLVYNQEPSPYVNNDINVINASPSASGDMVSYHTNIVHLPQPSGTAKLIESTKNLVSGADVININDSVENSNPDSESSTLQSLLQHYVTPNLNNDDINHLGEGRTTPSSLINQPIIVADEYPLEKPVVDENLLDENVKSTTESILVTPRPVNTNFLAPITAGIRLEESEKFMQDTRPTEQGNRETVVVTVQKSVPHYLGKYEYPTAYAAAYSGDNASDYAKEDIELGTTLLHFTEAPPHAEKLVQNLPKVEQEQIFSDITVNHLNAPQDNQIFDQSQFYPHQPHTVSSYPVQRVTERAMYTPQYVDEPMPFTQPHNIEVKKPSPAVQNKKVPHTSKHHTTLKNQIPWYDQKKHDVYLLQVPKQLFQPNKHQKSWNQFKTRHQNLLFTNHYESYAPQVKKYLPPKQRLNIDRGYLPIKGLHKLELEQFPKHNVHNLPPITKSYGQNLHTKGHLPPITQPWNSEIKNEGQLNSYIPAKTYLNLQSNREYVDPIGGYTIPDGYLPQQRNKCQGESCNSHEPQASFKNYFHIIPAATAPLGLVPPKSSGLRYHQDLAPSPSEQNKVTGSWYNNNLETLPLPNINIPSRFQHYEVPPFTNNAVKFNGGGRYNMQEAGRMRYQHEMEGKRSPRSHFFDESSVRMEYGFMPPFKPSQKIREVLEVNPE